MADRCVVVSCFAGWHGFDLAQGLDQAGLLEYLITLASPRAIEARYGIPRDRIKRLPLGFILHRLEWWANSHMPSLVRDAYFHLFCGAYDLFTRFLLSPHTQALVAWYPFASTALQWAADHGIVTIMDVGSIYPHDQYRLICREYSACKLPLPWVPSRVLFHTWSLDQVDWISVPSKAVYQSFIKSGIPAEKLLLNPYGTDVQIFKPLAQSSRHEEFTAEHPLRIIVVAGLTPRKGSRLLIDLCHHLVSDQRFHFTLVGSIDPLLLRRDQDFPSNLEILKPVQHPELVELFCQNHVCLLPSVEEGFARVLIEAAACGLTLVGTSSTGIADILSVDPHAGYQLSEADVSSAIEILHGLAGGSLPLCHASRETVEYYRRDAYQARAIKIIKHCLLRSA